jgi:hypothetical protein
MLKIFMTINNRVGFSLTEIMIATIVMTMIMFSSIAFIKSGADLWQRGHTKISSENYKRAAFELLKADLAKATEITEPQASSTARLVENFLEYKMDTIFGNKEFQISIDTDNSLVRQISSVVPDEQRIYNSRIARHVASFSVTRISTWTISIFLEIGSEPDDYGFVETISSDTVVFIAPQAG